MKRGNVLDLVLITVILMSAALAIFLANIFIDAFYANPVISSNVAAAATETQTVQSLSIFANSFIIIFIVFGLASAISAFFTETHPVFFVFSILLFGVCVLIVALLSDVFVELAASGVLLPVAANFVLMVDTIANLKTLSIIMGIVITVALFMKRGDIRVGGGQA